MDQVCSSTGAEQFRLSSDLDIVGEHGLRKRSLTVDWDRQLQTICADLPTVGSALRGFGAEGADQPGAALIEEGTDAGRDGAIREASEPSYG
jgi:hypothetical protein